MDDDLKTWVLLSLAIFFALRLISLLGKRPGRPRYSGPRRRFKTYDGGLRKYEVPPRPDLKDPAQQMNVVKDADFRRQPLMNGKEMRLFQVVEDICRELDRGYRVMAQTSLGEVLSTKSSDWKLEKDAYASINSKRIDISIFDPKGYLLAAVEFQGTGHHQGNAFMRDAVKREALRKAGVPMIEVKTGDTPSHVKTLLLRELDQGVQPPSTGGSTVTAMPSAPASKS